MAVRIRLARFGSKKKPHYRIVAADSESRRDGRFLEQLGTYSPCTTPPASNLDMDRYEYWRSMGALPSETVASIVRKQRNAPSA